MDTRSLIPWICLSLFFCLKIVHKSTALSTSSFSNIDAECKPNSSRPSPIQVIGENADLYINAIIAVHQSNSKGIYGCGQITQRGVVFFEAMRWLLSVINRNDGHLNSANHGPLIPGIKLGIKVYDSCDHRELALNQLIKMFPVVERGFDPCEEAATLNPNSIALIDLFGVSKDPKLVSLSRQYNLPIKLLEQDLFVPSDIVAKSLSQVMLDLKWTQVAIIHSPDEYSLQIIKQIGQASLKNNFCLTMINSLPKFDEDSYGASGSDSGAYISLLRGIISTVPINVPIFVLGSDKSVRRLFQIMADRIDVISKHQWLFSSLPDPAILMPFINSSVSFFTLSLYPASIDDFEQFWNYQHTLKENRTSSWFREYLNTYPSNNLKKSENAISREGSLDILWRTSQVTPIIQTLFILSLALREAWIDRCHETPGLCPDLLKLTRKEFESDFLSSVNPDSDTVKEAIISRAFGAKTSSLGDGVNLALTKLLFSGNNVQYKHMIAYDSDAEKGQILDSSVLYLSSPCPEIGCDKCLKLRQSRIVDQQNPQVQPSYSSWSFEKRSETNLLPKREVDCITKCSMQAEKLALSPWPREKTELNSDRISSGWYLALAVLSAIGILFIIVNGFYLLLAFPLQIADTPLDYLIMIGLVTLYLVNFVFLQVPSISICIIRRIGLSMSYSLIFSAMLVKAMNIWRMKTLTDNGLEKLRSSTKSRLTMVTCFLLSLQAIVTIIWLIIIPPKPNIRLQTCSWPASSDTLIATESIVSLVYILILISMNIFFSLMVWKSCQHDNEPRWIVASCVSTSIIWSAWIICSAYSNSLRTQTSLTIVCANLLSATIITVLLYARKFDHVLRCPSKPQRRPHFPGDLNGDRMSSQRGLNNSSFSGSQYGSLPSPQKLSISQFNTTNAPDSSIITASSTSNNNKTNILSSTISLSQSNNVQPIISPINNFSTFKNEHTEDGNSSCSSTTSSIQVQAEDLYPMEVYEGTGTLQQRYHNYYYNN